MSKTSMRLIISVIFISVSVFGFSNHASAACFTTSGQTQCDDTIAVSCVILNNNLHIGSSGSDVATLQQYLIKSGYLTLPTGVQTGFFGSVTMRAVKDFQRANGIDPTGFVGPITRAKLSLLTCGASAVPSITSVIPSSAKIGDQISIYGLRFATSSNTVTLYKQNASDNDLERTLNLGSFTAVTSCTTGTPMDCPKITLILPTQATSCRARQNDNNPCRSVPVTPHRYVMTVTNSKGTSNGVDFTVVASSSNNNQGTSTVRISEIRPTSGPVSTEITLRGSGFAPSGNNVNFSGVSNFNLNNLPSTDRGTRLKFTVPGGDDYECLHRPAACEIAQRIIEPGMHTVSVTTGATTSNNVNFNVTEGSNNGGNSTSTPHINSLSPASSTTRSMVTITGSGFTSNSSFNFGGVDIGPLTFIDSTHLKFTVPYRLCHSDQNCSQNPAAVTAGDYYIFVCNNTSTCTPNSSLKSNSVRFTVTAVGNNPCSTTSTATCSPYIDSFSPATGPTRTTVTITGAGFASNYRIYFGASQNANNVAVTFVDSTHLRFTIPSRLCLSSQNCSDNPQQVTPGTYQIKVCNNTSSTQTCSNSKPFTVTASNTASLFEALANLVNSGLVNQTATINNAINQLLQTLQEVY